MGVEFIEEVHNCVRSQGCRTNNYVFLMPRGVVRIAGAKFFTLNPKVGQLLELGGQNNQRYDNHHHNKQLRGPRFGLEVAEANR